MNESLLAWLQGQINQHSMLYFIVLYATGGKPAALGAAKLFGLNLWCFVPLTILMDALQAPCFFYLYNRAFTNDRLQWLGTRFRLKSHSIEGSRLFGMLKSLGNMGVFLITMMPIKGGGIWSGALLAHFLGMPKRISFPLLICSSFLSCLVILGLCDGMIWAWRVTTLGE